MDSSNTPVSALETSLESETDEISLLDLLQVVVDNLRLLVFGPLLVGLLALGVAYVIPPTFTATAKFLPPQQQQSAAAYMLQSLGGFGGLAGAAAGLKNPSDQYVSLLKSRTVQDTLIDRFKLLDRYDEKFRENARKVLDSNVLVSGGKDGLITIEASDKDFVFAAQLANACIEELTRLLSRLAITEAQQRRVFFEKQMGIAKDQLIKAETALKSSGIDGNVLKTSPVAAVEGVAKLKAAITSQEIKLASMRGYLTESAPDFKQAQTELSAMRTQLAQSRQEEPSAQGNPDDYVSKFREFKYFETLFELFTKQYEMARIDESREGPVIQVVDVAVPPELKSKPKKALISILVVLATGFVLLIWVFIKQAWTNAGQLPETNEKMHRLRLAWRKAWGRPGI